MFREMFICVCGLLNSLDVNEFGRSQNCRDWESLAKDLLDNDDNDS